MLLGGMTPSYWLFLGVALIVFEVATPAMVSIFFGLAALLVALLAVLIPGLPQWLEWLLFAAFSVMFLVTLRRWFRGFFPAKRILASSDPDRDIVGKHATVTQRIEPGRPGKVELRGAGWQAESDETLEPGTLVKVIKQESITLTVQRL